jgi:hypothetical protein
MGGGEQRVRSRYRKEGENNMVGEKHYIFTVL